MVKVLRFLLLFSDPLASVWILLRDLEGGDPLDPHHAPKTLLVLPDEAESLQRHGLLIVNALQVLRVLLVAVQELVRRHPSGPGAGVLPEILVVDRLSFRHLHVVLNVHVGSLHRHRDLSGRRTGQSLSHDLRQLAGLVRSLSHPCEGTLTAQELMF